MNYYEYTHYPSQQGNIMDLSNFFSGTQKDTKEVTVDIKGSKKGSRKRTYRKKKKWK